MRHHTLRVIFLSCFLGLTAGSYLFPLSSIQISVQAAEPNSQGSQDGVIKACTGQSINLGAPQLTEADLKVLTGCGSGVIPQLLEALKSRDWKVKVIAAHTLGLYGKQAQSVITELSSLMQDENADVRFAVAQALGDIGTEAVVPVLAKALQDKDENVRVSAADAFLRIGAVAKPAKPVLIAALWDGNWYVRSRVAKTISKLGLSTSDIPDIVEPLRDNPEPYNGAIVALMLSIYPPIFNKLEDLPLFFIEGLQNEDPKVRESAAIALGQISLTRPGLVRLSETVLSLEQAIKDQNPQVRINSIKALAKMLEREYQFFLLQKKSPQLIEKIESLIIKSLQDRETTVRKVSLDSSTNISDSKLSIVIFAALKAMQEDNTDIRQSAFDLLNFNFNRIDKLPSLQKAEIVKKVSLALTNSLYDKDAGVRQNAWKGLNGKLWHWSVKT